MSDLEQRVAAGAALLDRERPGWWEEVDLLSIEGRRRSLRTIYEFYSRAFYYEFADLDRLWIAAIAERRARAESVGPTAGEWAAQR